MPPTTSAPSRAVPALLAAVVASIVLGIIGMHALSTHGTMGTAHASAMTSPMTGAHGDMTAGPLTTPTAGAHTDASSTAPPKGDGHSLGGMVMLCFAMLAATAGALLLRGLRRKPRVWAHRPTVPISVTTWVTARHGTGPPYVWQFSVIRC